MSFDAPLVLWIGPLVAAVIGGLALWARSRRVAASKRWSEELGRAARGNGRMGFLALAATALATSLALAGPRWGSRLVVSEAKALNLVIAVDVSRSMLARDVRPSRLDRARLESSRLIHDLASDRIGLIAFAGQSFVLSPLTIDGSALQLLVESLDPEISSAGGTELAQVLRQGHELLTTTTEVADRVLVVFTDGEAHDSLGSALAQARILRESGIRLILVAEGTAEPTRIPVLSGSGEVVDYYRDLAGDYVETARRDDVLNSVADAAEAVVVGAEVPDQAGAIRELLASFKRSPQASTTAAQGISRAWIPAALAAVILLLHTFTRPTAALAGIVLAAGITTRVAAQAPANPGDRAWDGGDVEAAARHYLAQAREGVGGDTTWLNAGTAALAAGDAEVARQALTRAAESLDPDIRYRALFNLGYLDLALARQNQGGGGEHLESAVSAYREALLVRPGDLDAKWNLELALAAQASRSEAGGEDQEEQPEPGEERQEMPSGGEQELPLAQAEQILNSIADEERETRERLNQRRRSLNEVLRGKDW